MCTYVRVLFQYVMYYISLILLTKTLGRNDFKISIKNNNVLFSLFANLLVFWMLPIIYRLLKRFEWNMRSA